MAADIQRVLANASRARIKAMSEIEKRCAKRQGCYPADILEALIDAEEAALPYLTGDKA